MSGDPDSSPESAASDAGGATARIARHRHAAEIYRARSVMLVASALWIGIGVPLDLSTHGIVGRDPLWLVVLIRLAATGYHVVALGALFRSPLPSRRVADWLITLMFPITALSQTLLTSRMGGVTSPYDSAILVILMVQVLAYPGPWRRGALLAGLTGGIYPIGMLAIAAVDGTTRAQLFDTTGGAIFAMYIGVLGCGVVLATWGGHVVWSLRRSVFESRSIGRYRLIRRIGSGGMGEVWRAHDRALRREVALKLLTPEQGRSALATARFEREIEATAQLDHPDIVRVHDWGVTDDGVWFFAMELLHGIDLFSLIKRHGALPPALAAQVGARAARALAVAHERGIVHRDVKPGNLFLVTEGDRIARVVLLDFGVARIGDGVELTHPGGVLGTPGFIAPEVLAGATAGAAADIYGLAATLFFALTRKRPGEAGAGVAASALVDGIPRALDDAVTRGLDADPGRRQPSAAAFADELSAAAPPWPGSWSIAATGDEPSAELAATVDAVAPATRAESAWSRHDTPSS